MYYHGDEITFFRLYFLSALRREGIVAMISIEAWWKQKGYPSRIIFKLLLEAVFSNVLITFYLELFRYLLVYQKGFEKFNIHKEVANCGYYQFWSPIKAYEGSKLDWLQATAWSSIFQCSSHIFLGTISFKVFYIC